METEDAPMEDVNVILDTKEKLVRKQNVRMIAQEMDYAKILLVLAPNHGEELIVRLKRVNKIASMEVIAIMEPASVHLVMALLIVERNFV